jgi:hypothetical protein
MHRQKCTKYVCLLLPATPLFRLNLLIFSQIFWAEKVSPLKMFKLYLQGCIVINAGDKHVLCCIQINNNELRELRKTNFAKLFCCSLLLKTALIISNLFQ